MDLIKEEVEVKTPNPLTCHVLLSQIVGLYDPTSLVMLVKQKCVFLVKRAFQEAGNLNKDTWDEPLSDDLQRKSIELFKEYVRLSSITVHRSLTPHSWRSKPWGITFSDGSCASYGTVLYLQWETSDGVVNQLVEPKAKLIPLEQKGDAPIIQVVRVEQSRMRVKGSKFLGRWGKKTPSAKPRTETQCGLYFVNSIRKQKYCLIFSSQFQPCINTTVSKPVAKDFLNLD